MQASTIKFSQIEDRIDAEYYKPGYLEIINHLKSSPSLGEFIKIKNGYPFDSMLFGSGDFPVLRIRNFTEDEINFSELTTVPYYYIKENSCILPSIGEILVGMDGLAEFRAYLVNFPKDTKLTINQRIAIIKTIKNLCPEYIYIFLNSKAGQKQLLREMTTAGTVGHISNEIIKSLKIPIPPQFFQQKIEKMVKEVQEKRRLADEKYKKAEEVLNRELRLEDLDLSTQKTFEAKFSEAEDRLDPEYYQPKYKKIISKLEPQKSKLLDEVVKISNKKIDPNKNQSEEIKYVELANVNGSNGIIENCETYKHWQLPGRARMLIKTGDVLVSSLGGSIDKVGLVTKEYDNQVASTGFFIINSKALTSETLFLIFRNKIVSWQLQKNTRGAIMSAISENEFRNIIIPILSQSIQQKISSLIQESFKLRQETKELINEAKQKVEKLIEE